MRVNLITSATTQVSSQQDAANPKPAANSTWKSSAAPEDTVTLSAAALTLQTEQKILAAAAENRLSLAGEAAARLWRSALALISE